MFLTIMISYLAWNFAPVNVLYLTFFIHSVIYQERDLSGNLHLTALRETNPTHAFSNALKLAPVV